MPFYLESLSSATLMTHRRCASCAMDWNRTKYWGWVKTPVRFEVVCGRKLMKFGATYRSAFVLSKALARFSMSRFVQ